MAITGQNPDFQMDVSGPHAPRYGDPIYTEAERRKLQEAFAPDPWKHRSAGMKCNTCMWFVEKVRNLPPNTTADPFGRCRRHAPTHNGYPAVFGHDWCGDHKLDENKL